MVGSDPSKGNATTTIPVYIIPIRMVYGSENGHKVLDPLQHTVKNGLTVIQNVVASPIFDASVLFQAGKTSLGQTQYVDAFQRGNFWSSVSRNSEYHVLLGSPVILSEQTISVQPNEGSYGTYKSYIGTMDMTTFDNYLTTYIQSFSQIAPGALPIFVTYNVYLTDNGMCCTGGYHSVSENAQTYSYATYVDRSGDFSQDVSALSHEVGEWMDDPYANNVVSCNDPSVNHLLEVGDPLEGADKGEDGYGDYPYPLNGFRYNLQSLAFLTYFGASKKTSVNGWTSFHGPKDGLSVCGASDMFDPPGSTEVYNVSVNNGGTVAGSYRDQGGKAHGFVRQSDGTITSVDAPGSSGTAINSISENGSVIGEFSDGSMDHGFVLTSSGEFTVFDVPGEADIFPWRINSSGTILGEWWDGSRYHGFIRYPDGTITSFDPPGSYGALGTSVADINDSGTVVGSVFDGSVRHGYIRSPDGIFTLFDAPGSQGVNGTGVSAINASGIVVGQLYDSNNQGHGFVRDPSGTFTVFDAPRGVNTAAMAINAYNEIAGTSTRGNPVGFLRMPDGSFQAIVPPAGAKFSVPEDINDSGEVVGYARDARNGNIVHGFVRLP